MGRAVLVLIVVAGCLEPGLVPCGDRLCPAGTTCVAGELCATDDQRAACDGLPDAATCSVVGAVGRCDRGVCVIGSCGNGSIEQGELCDDGNVASGDGCRADCGKVEVCGDAMLDDGEGCDDGNTNAADGCDACRPTQWTATTRIGAEFDAKAIGLAIPGAVALDSHGNLYIADTGNNRIRRVDASGYASTFAGLGTQGYAGDGGDATSASLSQPVDVVVDGLGNVFIAESGRVRRVDPQGTITTVAGTGIIGFTGDNGLATAAQVGPISVAVDGLGQLYIADAYANRIRKVDTAGIITTIAGTGNPGSTGDGGLAIDATLAYPTTVRLSHSGEVYFIDGGNERVRKIDSGGIVRAVAGSGTMGYAGDGGPATAAQLASPRGLTFDANDNLLISDPGNYRIRIVDASTQTIETVAGNGTGGGAGDGGPAALAQLLSPLGLATDPTGYVYFADAGVRRIRRFIVGGTISHVAGAGGVAAGGDGGLATSATLGLSFPQSGGMSLARDGAGGFYLCDGNNHRLRRVTATGVIDTIAGTGVAGSAGDGGPARHAQLFNPSAVARDTAGNLYIADRNNHRIRKIDTSGTITTIAGNGNGAFSGDNGPAIVAELYNPSSVAVDATGNVFVADTSNQRIRRIDTAGTITTIVGDGTAGFSGDGGPPSAAQIAFAPSIRFDTAGNLLVVDAGNARVRKITGNVIDTIAGGGSGLDGSQATAAALVNPLDVDADAAGNLFIAERGGVRVRKVDTAGVISTIAGTGAIGSEGDGGPAISAGLFFPQSVLLDGAGGVLIADRNNRRVRRIDPSGEMSTVAGAVDPEGLGPFMGGRLANPRALLIDPAFTLFAGGGTGTVQIARAGTQIVRVAAGRYPQVAAVGNRARYRDRAFGAVTGIAYDAAAKTLYLTETTNHRIYAVTAVDPTNEATWTIATIANIAGVAGHADGAPATAMFREPAGLYVDAPAHQLYVADAGNHVIRAIDLTDQTVRTIAGAAATRGYLGDGGPATSALLYSPQAITRCANGDLFIADSGNHRVRRIAAATGVISTVLGDGGAASSGEGSPAYSFPVNEPLGLACDATGNLYVTSTTTVRLLAANAQGVVDGSGSVQTIYGKPPVTTFPQTVTRCLTGLAVLDATHVQVVDSCTGLLVELARVAR